MQNEKPNNKNKQTYFLCDRSEAAKRQIVTTLKATVFFIYYNWQTKLLKPIMAGRGVSYDTSEKLKILSAV